MSILGKFIAFFAQLAAFLTFAGELFQGGSNIFNVFGG